MAQKIEEKKRIALAYEESQEWFTRKKKSPDRRLIHSIQNAQLIEVIWISPLIDPLIN